MSKSTPAPVGPRLTQLFHRSPSKNWKPIATLPYSKNRKSFRFRFFSDNVISEVEILENLKIHHVFILTVLLTIHDQIAKLSSLLTLKHYFISRNTNILPRRFKNPIFLAHSVIFMLICAAEQYF